MAGNVELGKVVVREDVVLEKYDGEVSDGVLVERIFLTDGVKTKHEVFEDGKVVKTELYENGKLIKGGEDNSTN